MLISSIIELCKIPIKASFQEIYFTDSSQPVKMTLLFLIPLILAILEIILNFNTGFYHDGAIV